MSDENGRAGLWEIVSLIAIIAAIVALISSTMTGLCAAFMAGLGGDSAPTTSYFGWTPLISIVVLCVAIYVFRRSRK